MSRDEDLRHQENDRKRREEDDRRRRDDDCRRSQEDQRREQRRQDDLRRQQDRDEESRRQRHCSPRSLAAGQAAAPREIDGSFAEPVIVQHPDKLPLILRVWPFEGVSQWAGQDAHAVVTLNALGQHPTRRQISLLSRSASPRQRRSSSIS